MKRCPECRRDYYDETLLYCLDDGTALLEGPVSQDGPATAILPSEEKTRMPDGKFSEHVPGPTQPFIGLKRRRLIASVLGAGLIAASVLNP